MEQQETVINDLYQFEISRFMDLLKEDRNYAFQRYGCTLMYSLPSEETFKLLYDLGWERTEAIDFYNKGTIECQNENFDEAMKNFEKAESMNCEQPELYFNMALLYENQDDNNNAKLYFQKYIDAVEKWDEIPKSLQKELDDVRQHIKTME